MSDVDLCSVCGEEWMDCPHLDLGDDDDDDECIAGRIAERAEAAALADLAEQRYDEQEVTAYAKCLTALIAAGVSPLSKHWFDLSQAISDYGTAVRRDTFELYGRRS